jgi:hypothetical protein
MSRALHLAIPYALIVELRASKGGTPLWASKRTLREGQHTSHTES